MINYFAKGIKDVNSELVIDIDYLQWLIRNNPNKELIKKLWTCAYKSKEYDRIKQNLPYVTPHGTFLNKRDNASIKKFSGLLFFDIDAKDINTGIEEYIATILGKYNSLIFMLGKSVGGRGLFFYVKIKDGILTADNFMDVYEYFKSDVFKELPIDNSAKGISRPQFIPYDENLYVNEDVVVNVPNYLLAKLKIISSSVECAEQYNNTNKGDVLYCSTSSFLFLDINDILKEMITETFVDIGDKDFLYKPIDYYKVRAPLTIPIGRRHRTYRAMINNIVPLNPTFTLQQVASYINFINYDRAEHPLSPKELMRTVRTHYNKVKSEGVKNPRMKSMHTNPKNPRAQRMQDANRENGLLRKQKSISGITMAIEELRRIGSVPTVKEIQIILEGRLSKRTIQKYWRQVV